VQIHHYTAAKIPLSVGIRFFVGKLVERLYADALISRNEVIARELSGDLAFTGGNRISSSSLDLMRMSLGHPFHNTSTVNCLVASFNGLDSVTFVTRASVAARLWIEGITAEYFAQSGSMMSLRQHTSNAYNWNEVSEDVGVSKRYVLNWFFNI